MIIAETCYREPPGPEHRHRRVYLVAAPEVGDVIVFADKERARVTLRHFLDLGPDATTADGRLSLHLDVGPA